MVLFFLVGKKSVGERFVLLKAGALTAETLLFVFSPEVWAALVSFAAIRILSTAEAAASSGPLTEIVTVTPAAQLRGTMRNVTKLSDWPAVTVSCCAGHPCQLYFPTQ